MGRDVKRPDGYKPLLELYLRKKKEGGDLLVPSVFHAIGDAMARRECLVLIHGFNNTDGEAATAYFGFRGRQNDIFKPPDPTIFDRRFGDSFWPGDADWWWFFDKVDFLIYPSAVHTAIKAGEQIADLLMQLPNLERVEFITHSLGGRVGLEAVAQLRARTALVIGKLCLMAAAVPSEMLEPGGRYYQLLSQLCAGGTQIMVLHSMQDPVLHLAFPPGQALAGAGEGSARALGRFGPMPSMPGYGATLKGQEINGASHGDYWGDSKSDPSKVATKAAGRFLALGDIGREISVPREIGSPTDWEPAREISYERELGE
jgi:pimeloyl-ACP methyl ester carboxylesterase